MRAGHANISVRLDLPGCDQHVAATVVAMTVAEHLYLLPRARPLLLAVGSRLHLTLKKGARRDHIIVLPSERYELPRVVASCRELSRVVTSCYEWGKKCKRTRVLVLT